MLDDFVEGLLLQMLSTTSDGRTIPVTANLRDSRGVALAFSRYKGTGQGNLEHEIKQDGAYEFAFAT